MLHLIENDGAFTGAEDRDGKHSGIGAVAENFMCPIRFVLMLHLLLYRSRTSFTARIETFVSFLPVIPRLCPRSQTEVDIKLNNSFTFFYLRFPFQFFIQQQNEMALRKRTRCDGILIRFVSPRHENSRTIIHLI